MTCLWEKFWENPKEGEILFAEKEKIQDIRCLAGNKGETGGRCSSNTTALEISRSKVTDAKCRRSPIATLIIPHAKRNC